MPLSRDDVLKVADLARLELGPEELETLTRQLDQIVRFVQQLEQLDTEGVEPMAHAGDLANVLAEDEPAESLDREAALANAPKRDAECFRVPAVLGDS